MTPTDIFIDPVFDPVYARDPLVLVDVGARGGLKGNWAAAARHLRVIGFEPDPEEFRRLSAQSAVGSPARTFLGVALHNRREPLRLFVARDRGLTSIFEPNREFLDAFPEADRFDTVSRDEVQADTLDSQLAAHGIADVDFLKVDTQGSELFVLEGAAAALDTALLGVEIEVEFTPIYRDQPLFADVDQRLRRHGFELFDLRPCYWKRAAGRAAGGPRGQIIWADALYFRSLPALTDQIGRAPADRQRSKVLKAISIALLYGYVDLAVEMVKGAPRGLSSADRETIERRLRRTATARSPLPAFPGKGRIASAFGRLSRLFRDAGDAWSISDAEIGNLER